MSWPQHFDHTLWSSTHNDIPTCWVFVTPHLLIKINEYKFLNNCQARVLYQIKVWGKTDTLSRRPGMSFHCLSEAISFLLSVFPSSEVPHFFVSIHEQAIGLNFRRKELYDFLATNQTRKNNSSLRRKEFCNKNCTINVVKRQNARKALLQEKIGSNKQFLNI